MNKPSELVIIFKALADPTRLKVFKLLLAGEYCSCELNQATGLSINLLSHHLKVLRTAGLINAAHDPADTRWIHYSVNQEKLMEARSAINHLLVPNINRRRSNCPTPKKRKVS